MELDEEQRKALQPHVRLIEAGPGAGKTRTIVERFVSRVSVSDCGVALISFTNAAIDEARRRCPAKLLQYPHFVGTIDAFLHRYIVTPLFIRSHGISPVYVRSWGEYKNTDIHCGRMSVPLDAFLLIPHENSVKSIEILDDKVKKLDECIKRKIVREAQNKLFSFYKKGIISCEYARRYALLSLQNNSVIVYILRNRFSEIIVDEFQDCSYNEVQIVELLAKAGIHFVSVADPYQAIYGFRGVYSLIYQNYRKSMIDRYPGCDSFLKTNYRSIGDICNFISALRGLPKGGIIAANKVLKGELSVLVGTNDEQLELFKCLIGKYGIQVNDAIVLAHSRDNARTLAGKKQNGDIGKMSKGNISGLLKALYLFYTSDDSLGRHKAVHCAVRVIVDSYNWSDNVSSSNEDRLALLGISLNIVRYMIITLVSSLFKQEGAYESKDSCSQYVQQFLAAYLPKQGSGKSTDEKTIKQRFPKLVDRDWREWKKCMNDLNGQKTIQCSHIHGVKGEEYEAVLLSTAHSVKTVPVWDVNVSDSLADNINSESFRMFYVGASRAKRVLAIGVDKKNKDRFLRWMSDLGLHNGDDFHVYSNTCSSFQSSLNL